MSWFAVSAIVVSVAGTGMQMAAQAKSQRAQGAAKAAELKRQSALQKKAMAIVAEQTQAAGADKAVPAINAASDARVAAYNRITAPAQQPTQTVSRSVSTPMAAATANQANISNAWNNIIGAAQAKAGGFQDWGLARNIAQQRGSQAIGLIGRNARGSAEASGAEQFAASHAGDGLAAGGQIVGLVGQGLGTYAATRPSASSAANGYNPKMDSFDYDPNMTFVNTNLS